MHEELFSQANDWSFPEFELDQKSQADDILDSLEKSIDQDTFTKQEIAEIEAKKEIELHIQQNNFLKEEIDDLRNSMQAQSDVMNKLIAKLKTPLSIIDEEIVELMQDIIKKLTKRIICKEIAAEPSIISQMVNELRSIVDSKHGLLSITLSLHDYENLATLKTDLIGIACVDNELNSGDIIIKSNFGEVRGLLNERIEQLLRIDHD